MTRRLLVVMLLTTGVAMADKKPEAKHAVDAAKTHAKTKADQPAKTEAPAETKKAQKESDEEEPQANTDPKLTSVPGGKALGMSILGNQEAPKSLVIVPWKSSEVGRSSGIPPLLDDSRQPVDKEVFMRALRYYAIRSEKKQ
jgi:hypothetical protein